jgi:hypothetical protein
MARLPPASNPSVNTFRSVVNPFRGVGGIFYALAFECIYKAFIRLQGQTATQAGICQNYVGANLFVLSCPITFLEKVFKASPPSVILKGPCDK